MSDATLATAYAVRVGRPSRRLFAIAAPFAREARFAVLGLLLVALMLPTGLAAWLDPRQIAGISVWDKPLKFQLALSTYLLTLAAFAAFLPPGLLASRRYRLYAQSVCVAIVAEMVWLMGAAALGVPSHFNRAPLGMAIYAIMGVLAIWLTSVTMVYAVAIARHPAMRRQPALREGLVLGLGLVLPLTLVAAGFMSAWGSHHMAGQASDAGGLVLLGWSRTGGDLRVAHFLATHALHFVPLATLVAIAVTGPERIWPARLAALFYVALVGWSFVLALLDQPFLPFLG